MIGSRWVVRIVRIVPVRRIERIARVKLLGRIERTIGIKPIRRVERILGMNLVGRIEDVEIAFEAAITENRRRYKQEEDKNAYCHLKSLVSQSISQTRYKYIP